MEAPVDHLRPEVGTIDVGLIRVTAADPQRREGTIFYHPGGPGSEPSGPLIELAELWSITDAADPIHGGQRELADRYDLVAVVHRGLPGGRIFDCSPVLSTFHVLASDRSKENLHAADEAARDLGFHCTRDSFHAYVSTEQVAYDMDLARRALHEDKLNFYGVSYGTWVGAWYGAMFPQNVGRMLLDSSMNFTANFADAATATAQERHRRFVRLALKPAIAQPALYGLGTDEEAILARFRNMPQRALAEWATHITSAEALTAALVMADWVRAHPFITEKELTERVETQTFSHVLGIDAGIRSFARHLVARYFGDVNEPSYMAGGSALSVYLAVNCNDTERPTDPAYWNALAQTHARLYPGGSRNEAFNLCGYWGKRVTRRPSLEPLHAAPPILMVHAEYDDFTPLSNASIAWNALGNASMIVARGMSGHGIFSDSDTPCVEQGAATYLLTGKTPEHKFSSCNAVVFGQGRNGRSSAATEQRIKALRAQHAARWASDF
ncbi:pimeloyl-ACP methyl ester carboxylesterase [Luteibacter sp. Sphag1AF]|uniref:alpha/beta hydrolase n=1 Tax=Luteibacter sp. Sphag1AF TaxID=2587031 RepID=UPI001609FE25|nr:alpha/beta hydrolase [Luteibacter sp. Sphag1AF]MBB3226536.1 pimeloyl-ACP methyl ester carboxylesterase [Luteibacter sp. Sphag1AF]